MATNVTMTTFGDLMKRWYVDKKNLHRMDESTNNLLKAVKKDPTGEGDTWSQPITVNTIVGGAANYTIGRANATAGVDKVFRGTWKERYDFASIDQKVISTSKSDKGAFAPVLKLKIDGLRSHNQRMTNFQLYRDEGGAIAQISNATSTGGGVLTSATGTFTTATKTALQYVAQNHILNFGPTRDGLNLRTGAVQIQGKSDLAGIFKTTSPVPLSTQVTSIADGDYVFIAGTSGSTDSALAGLESWIPATEALAATTFKNCDRTVDTRALGGIRIDGSTAGSNEEAYIDGVSTVEQYGGAPKVIMCHTLRYAQLAKELSDRKRFVTNPGQSFDGKGKTAAISYGGLSLDGGEGEVVVVKDAACQYGYSWILNPDDFTLYSAGTWPFVRGVGTDNLQMLRATDSGAYITELFAYGEFVCSQPGKNAIIVH
jgi:hypothetical protein